MELPANLLHGVETGNIVLVLGAGASIGATRPDGTGSPAGARIGPSYGREVFWEASLRTNLCQLFPNTQPPRLI